MRQIKIAMFSFADIDNYGDILFSHVFKMEMEKRIPNLLIDFYCPTTTTIEGINYKAYKREKVESKYDALILAGGEVVHFFDDKTWLPIYKKRNLKTESRLPSDIVWDWISAKSNFKAWISVGVRYLENIVDFNLINDTLNNLNYVSVRGILSKKILENLDLQAYNSKINITPDLGWLFPDFMIHKKAVGVYYKRYIDEKFPYLIFQINNIDNLEAKFIADSLVEFQSKENMKVYLLPIIRPWEDDKYLKMIYEYSDERLTLLPNNLNIFEIADIIIHSRMIVCSSMHAAITALAKGIPAGILNKWQGTKLQDSFGHQFRLFALRNDIKDLVKLLNLLKSEQLSHNRSLLFYTKFMQSELKSLFDTIANKITNENKYDSYLY